MEDRDDPPFLEGFDLLKIPVVEDGRPVWPEKFPLDKIERVRRSAGPRKFMSQMMLAVPDGDGGRLSPESLKFYSAEIEASERNHVVSHSVAGRPLAGYSCWWDPSFGSAKGDASVVAYVLVGCGGERYLHDVEYIAVDDSARSAEIQCARIAGFLARHSIRTIRVEDNGLGKFLPEILRARTGAAVIAERSKAPKEKRILDSLEVAASAGLLYVHERVRSARWMDEFMGWTPGGGSPDDGLDAAAGAMSAPFAKFPFALVRRRFPPRGKTYKVRWR
ncbi:MAG: hypothetical protein LBT92_00950 [Rickettsiales bacterium]|jgi:hypothetical protein|nr:hypothetical protein [Rickettsiales bacterium]